jgi:hypothetical protein
MKKITFVLVALCITTSSTHCMFASLMSTIQKNLGSLMSKGTEMISKQSGSLIEMAKTQTSALLEKAKAQAAPLLSQAKEKAMPLLEKAKEDIMAKAKELGAQGMEQLKEKAQGFAQDAKEKVVAQVQGLFNKQSTQEGKKVEAEMGTNNDLLAQMTPQEKRQIVSMTPSEQQKFVQEAQNQAELAGQNFVRQTHQIQITTAQAVESVGKEAVVNLQATIDAQKRDLRARFGATAR